MQKIAETSAFSPSKGQIDHPVALAGNITTTSSDDCQQRKISQTVSSSHHCHRNKNNNNKNYQNISSIKHKRKKQKPTNASSSSSNSVKIVLPCQLGALSEENEKGEHPNNRVLGACRIMVQPTLPYPLVPPYSKGSPNCTTTTTGSTGNTTTTTTIGKKKHFVKRNSSLKAIVKFATATLSRNISSQERRAARKDRLRKKPLIIKKAGLADVTRPRPPALGLPPAQYAVAGGLPGAHAGPAAAAWLATSTTTRLPPRPINPSSLRVVRRSFEVAAAQGFLKHPVIHVEFNSPKNCRECCCCMASDFLYVYVGLCNVFLIQFVMVVLWFFSQSEVKLSDFGPR